MDQGIAILITAAVAVFSLFATSAFSRRLLRKQHTYRVLEKMNDWDRFDEALSGASKLIHHDLIPRLNCAEDEPACDMLDFLLSHYEFIAASIICGDVDERLVKKVEESRMCRVYLKFIDYVDSNRIDRKNDQIWENLEFMAYRWAVEKTDSFDNWLEWIAGRPFMGNFQNQREEIAASLHAEAIKIR